MYESIYKNNEVENEVSLDMSYFWYSDDVMCLVKPKVLHVSNYFSSADLKMEII
jgi:hypothetical protein